MTGLSPPVLVVAFNRPDRVRALVDRLREVAPDRVYVAVDGPRAGVVDDVARVRATHQEVQRIDWTPHVRRLIRTTNLGCGKGVSGAVDWFFQHEDRGIVLEDDVLPDATLFPFCAELLDRYADDRRVWAVSGCNFVPPEHIDTKASYRFASVPHIWGWATWRRSWASYRYDLSGWRSADAVRDLWVASGRSPVAFSQWAALFELTSRGAVDTWDFQAVLAAFRARGLTATSNSNLVSNVGFGQDSTHTVLRPNYLRPVGGLSLPLRHPDVVTPDLASDRWTRRHVLGATPKAIAEQVPRLLRQLTRR